MYEGVKYVAHSLYLDGKEFKGISLQMLAVGGGLINIKAKDKSTTSNPATSYVMNKGRLFQVFLYS